MSNRENEKGFHRPAAPGTEYNNTASGLGTAPTWLTPRKTTGVGPAGPTGPAGAPGGIQFNIDNEGGWLLVRSNAVATLGAGLNFRDRTSGGINLECETEGPLQLITDGSGDISLLTEGTGSIDFVSQHGSILLQTQNGGMIFSLPVNQDLATLISSGGRYHLQLSAGAQMVLDGLITASPVLTDEVWRDSEGFVRIGPGVDSGASPPPGVGQRQFIANQYGPMPATISPAVMYRVPYFNGFPVTFTLSRASLHLETPGTSPSLMLIEKSSTPNTFTAVPITALTVNAGNYAAADITAGLGTISSGDLLRFRWTALGTGARNYYVQLEGSETP